MAATQHEQADPHGESPDVVSTNKRFVPLGEYRFEFSALRVLIQDGQRTIQRSCHRYCTSLVYQRSLPSTMYSA